MKKEKLKEIEEMCVVIVAGMQSPDTITDDNLKNALTMMRVAFSELFGVEWKQIQEAADAS